MVLLVHVEVGVELERLEALVQRAVAGAAVLRDGEASDVGVREAHALMAALGVEPAQLVEGAYVDLLAR